jgi:ribosomal protein L20
LIEDKENPMPTIRTAPASMERSARTELFASGGRNGTRRHAKRALRRLWMRLIALSDREDAATADVPPEFYRFPPF